MMHSKDVRPRITDGGCRISSNLLFVEILFVAAWTSLCSGASYTLTVTADHGSATVSPKKAQYEAGDVVRLVALPDAGYSFRNWTGDVNTHRLAPEITMDGHKSVTANFGPWVAPIGIPDPNFGVRETYRMYDDPANRNESLTYNASGAGGYYTHYVDKDHPSATNAGNPYGTIAKPRVSMPSMATVLPGSVVEIHGKGYTGNTVWSCEGTPEQPIFIRGVSRDERPIFTSGNTYPSGRYMIFENIHWQGAYVIIRPLDADDPASYICVRQCESQSHNYSALYPVSYTSGMSCRYIVMYGNEVHPDNMTPPDSQDEPDNVAIGYIGRTEHYWIVDNHIYGAAGDACGSGHGANYQVKDVYMGRNVMHDCSENAVDVKEVENVIISQNAMFNMAGGTSGQIDGVPIVLHYGPDDGPKNTWVLFNEIYNANGCAIQVGGGVKYPVYVIGNVIHDIRNGVVQPYIFASFDSGADFIYEKLRAKNYVHADGTVDPDYSDLDAEFRSWFPEGYDQFSYIDARLDKIKASSETATSLRTWQCNYVYMINNTTYNVDNGVDWDPPSGRLFLQNEIISNISSRGFHISLVRSRDKAGISDCIFHQPGGNPRIVWDNKTCSNLGPWMTMSGKGLGCLDDDPLFVAPTALDFHLQEGSPAVGIGDGNEVFSLFRDSFGVSIEKDFDGQTRPVDAAWDIGAYEYGLRPSVAVSLSVSAVTQNSVTVAWTAPEGQMTGTHYDARFSENPLTEADWEAATRAQSEPVPGGGGAQESFTITGLNPGTTYYVGVRTCTRAGIATSPLSNVVSATTAASGNHAPVMQAIGEQSVMENATLTFAVRATDADGDPLSYSARNVPAGASFDPATQTFTWTPTAAQRGTCCVTLLVSDGHVQVSQDVSIVVTKYVAPPNRAPVLAAVGDQSVEERALLSFSLSASDPDEDSLTFTAADLPAGASFENATFRWTPLRGQAGSYQTTFSVSDGMLTDSKPVSITVVRSVDRTSPSVHDFFPLANSVQVPVNPVIAFTISDADGGMDAGTVSIEVNGETVYSGDRVVQETGNGICRRTGTPESLRYSYQSARVFDIDQDVSVRVSAVDLAGNTMTPVSWDFQTQMPIFGQNQPVGTSGVGVGCPSVARDSQGNLWAVWHAGRANAHNVYLARYDSQSQQWEAPQRLTNAYSDQCNPAIAIGSDDTVYVVWQDRRRFSWDIYVAARSSEGTWREAKITTSFRNETNPAIVVDQASPSRIHIAYEDDRISNRDICLTSLTTSFTGARTTRVTSDRANQTHPVLAVGSDNTVYVAWTDNRKGTADVYGSSSRARSWANVPIVAGPGNQQDAVIAVEPGSSLLHVLWVDDRAGNSDILYGTCDGLPSSPIAGTSIIDDSTAADQLAPAIRIVGDDQNACRVYACWLDNRSMVNNADSDLYFTEIRAGAGRTNVFVGDDGTNSTQREAALGFDEYGQPVVLWSDDRDNTTQIYSAFSTYPKPVPLASAWISSSAGGRVGPDPASIDEATDVCVEIPPNAYSNDILVSVSQIQHPPKFPSACIAGYEIGPSGVQFSVPVRVSIPYATSASHQAVPYWYDPLTGNLSDDGLTEATNEALANGISVVSFRTTHLTTFYILESSIQ
ncbi:MAG: fibronectin type III domain-containing protein [Sedimentisphaerales bacterium]|nr:fibronectin type III domain-containing protein [Sedimentisphaerales bacterium]